MQKPCHTAKIRVPKYGSAEDVVEIRPHIVEARWTRNNHLVADELVLTIPWKEGGVDPRMMKNANVIYWLWDDEVENLHEKLHLRFTGICMKAKRRLSESGWVVDMTFYDYTTLFISMKNYPTTGMPEWSDTLEAIWTKLCDNTGWRDPDSGKVSSSVAALRGNLKFTNDALKTRTLGEMESARFLKISKPQPKQGASAWDVWQWCIGSLGLLSYIDKDECWVTTASDYYQKADAAHAIYGHNIFELEEECDNAISSKGILLKSFNPLTGEMLEAFYPPPGDIRLKTRRSAARPKSEGGTAVTANEVSADFDEFARYDIKDQATLDACARNVYEDRCRQELQGSFRTAEMQLQLVNGDMVDIYTLRSGDSLVVATDPEINHDTLRSLAGVEERVRYLMDHVDYTEDVARLIAENINYEALTDPMFHIQSMQVELTPEKFEVEVKFHNVILTAQ